MNPKEFQPQINNSNYYVYLHRRADDGKVFYIGKGRGTRADSRKGRNLYWKRVANKHDYFVEYLYKNISEPLAFALEILKIWEYRRLGYSLANLTNGGEGTSGKYHDKETRKKQGEKNKGNKYRLDKRIHKFYHINGDMFTGTRSEFIEKYQLKAQRIAALFCARRNKVVDGWSLSVEKESHGNSDTKVYTFFHKDGNMFVGTRQEFCNKYKIDGRNLAGLFQKIKARRTACGGWSLKVVNG